MALANILVHLDSRPRTAARVGLSLRIAERCGARLTGMFAERADAHVVGTVATWPSAHYVAARDKAQAAFAAATAPLKDRAAFIDVNRGSDHEIIRRATEIARTFDLVVLGQAQDDVPVPAKLPDEVIAESGRPVLVVPYVGTYADVGARPLFAWHGERGAARAAFDALPLLNERAAKHSSSKLATRAINATNSPTFWSPISPATKSTRAISTPWSTIFR